MAKTRIEIVQALLNDRKNLDVVRTLCIPEATYVSLNYSNPDLNKSMPWCGTCHGPEAIVSQFVRVEAYWTLDDFSPDAMFSDDEHGSMTVTSKVLGRTVTSPFPLFCQVTDGKVTYMQYMEDTFATSSTFRSGGTRKFGAIQRAADFLCSWPALIYKPQNYKGERYGRENCA
jgi:hypothetical protein